MGNALSAFLNLRMEPLNVDRDWNLPLYLRNGYRLQPVRIAGRPCLLAEPLDTPLLDELRKHREQLNRITGLDCVFRFERLGTYRKARLIEDGIPFLVGNRQMYLPFLGLVLEREKDPPVASEQPFSTTARRFLLSAILFRWNEVSMKEAAEHLGLTRMSMSRCFDELDGASIGSTSRRNRERVFVWNLGARALWDAVHPHLASPVLRTLRTEDPTPLPNAVLGGLSALCSYSNLADNRYPTYAATRSEVANRGWDALPRAPSGEAPGKIIQVLSDWIPYGSGVAVDPLTAILCLTKEERQEARVEKAIHGVLDEVLHG